MPYTIVRPCNCVGIGEHRALRDRDIWSGNTKLATSHVVPDWCRILKGQDLHISSAMAIKFVTTRTVGIWRAVSALPWSTKTC